MKAAERFDVERGFRFISYAVWWIRQSIIQALKDKSRMVRLPQSQTALLSRITQAREHLRNAGVMNPHSERVAEQLGIPVEKVRVVTQANRAVLDLESHGETGNQLSLADTLVAENQPLPDERLTRESLSIDLESLLTKLTEREAEVIRRYYGLGREEAQTLQQIGDEIGLTRERIRQIKEKALEQMRRSPYPDRINGRPQPG
jgi:RNA polymerase primary sigma factor